MASSSDGPKKKPRKNPHHWLSLEQYQLVHQERLRNHTFVDHSRPDTIVFGSFFNDHGEFIVSMAGEVYCLHNVILEVEKYMETRRTKNRRLQVRTFSFRYNARIKGKHNILRYDNGHWWVPDEFHRHVFALDSGAELGVDRFTIEEMPTMSEILDELEAMF